MDAQLKFPTNVVDLWDGSLKDVVATLSIQQLIPDKDNFYLVLSAFQRDNIILHRIITDKKREEILSSEAELKDVFYGTFGDRLSLLILDNSRI
jgi:hypothetical protein